MKRLCHLLGFFAILASGFAAADTSPVHDIEIVALSPRDVHLPRFESAIVSVGATNLGPDRASDIRLDSALFPHHFYDGYVLSLPDPPCGELSLHYDWLNTPIYTIILAELQPNESVVCNVQVARGPEGHFASDLRLRFSSTGGGDPEGTNNSTYFNVGSLVDVSLTLTPVSFDIDADGIATEVVRLDAINHGPSTAHEFAVGACLDFGAPGFSIDGEFNGGCGEDVGYACFDWGLGFRFPAMTPGEKYTCSLRLQSDEPYAGPLRWDIEILELHDAEAGGQLIDTNSGDNRVTLHLAPFADPIFLDGFESR